MEDRPTALRDRPDTDVPLGRPAPARKWSRAPHHRRRRATAGLVVAVLLLAVSYLVVPSGAGTARLAAAPPTGGFFERLQALAGEGAGALAAQDAGVDATLAYTPYVRIAGAQHRELALTFDDGPGPYTPQIVSILKRANVPATFFEVGVLERYFHSSTSRIIAAGDVLGDHTFYHAPMGRLSPQGQQTELLQGAASLQRFGAPFPRLFRPPYGIWNSATLLLLRRYRMLMVLWTVDTNDYRLPGWAAIVRSAVAGAKPGAIILLHDGGGNRSETVAALPKIIAELRARSYKLVTVPKLLRDNPPPRDQQISSLIGAPG
jgi:peptidoglycan-N-acetylglucosamine deacetylase